VGFANQKIQAPAGAAENCREIMFVLSPGPGLAPFRRLTHGFTVGCFRTRLPALKNSAVGVVYL
jgi:hypothetical protein